MPRLKLERCPFCGAKVSDSYPDMCQFQPKRWAFTHYCETPDTQPAVVVTVYGSTKREAAQRWNDRVAAK